MLYIALAIATVVPAVFLIFLYGRDFYGTGSFRTVLLCFAWGMVAFGLAYGISDIIFSNDLLTRNQWVQLVAPITEEILKALILIYLVRRPNFTYFVDGAVYGFAAGIGFAVVENWSYVLGFGGAGLGVAVGRVLSTNLVHATASALVGIALGY
jgi:RsiW-degrading membrane proteinase PrsW (M82 family)